jgi:hypothetical protein
MLRFTLALVAVAALTIVPALIEGRYVHRWGTPVDLTAAADQLQQFPKMLGPWKFVHRGDPLVPFAVQELGLAGYINWNYRNSDTGETATLLLMVGVPGKLVRHPPDICYANRGHRQLDQELLEVSGPGGENRFKLLTYEQGLTVPTRKFHVAYGFSDNGIWETPTTPRVRYGGAGILYKAQIVAPLTNTTSEQKRSITSFTEAMTAAFQKHIASPGEPISPTPSTP